MAEIDGPIRFKGRLKGIRAYKLTGSDKTYVATTGSVSKEVRKHNRAFDRQHDTNCEFTARTMLAKDIRNAFGLWSLPIVHRYLHGNLTAKLKDVQYMDKESIFGKRNIHLTQYKDLLYQVTYYYYKPLSDILRCPYTVVDDESRKKVTVTLKGLHPLRQIVGPAQASHFQLCLTIGRVKDYTYDEEWKSYKSYGYRGGYDNSVMESEWMAIDAGLMGDFSMSVSLPEAYDLKDDETVVRVFGIVFGRMTAEVVPLSKDRGSIVFLGAV